LVDCEKWVHIARTAFLRVLTLQQSPLITDLVEAQKPALYEIVDRRTDVATLLRQFMSAGTPDEAAELDLMDRYGELDGEILYRYATAFAQVSTMLSDGQRAQLVAMRLISWRNWPIRPARSCTRTRSQCSIFRAAISCSRPRLTDTRRLPGPGHAIVGSDQSSLNAILKAS
jgi:hypothetical protein